MNKTIEFDEKCPSCKGTGVYVGMAEHDGAAVVCHTCKGTGCHHFEHIYEEFDGKKLDVKIKRVYEVNPGICIGVGNSAQYILEDFGGMPYSQWFNGRPFPPRSENRSFTCPAWWYQSANYEKKPNWDECIFVGSFSSCEHFCNKGACWARWDREYEED